jgi:hypothetical protein
MVMLEIPSTLIVEGLNDLLTLSGGLTVKFAVAGPAVLPPACKTLVVFVYEPCSVAVTVPVMVQLPTGILDPDDRVTELEVELKVPTQSVDGDMPTNIRLVGKTSEKSAVNVWGEPVVVPKVIVNVVIWPRLIVEGLNDLLTVTGPKALTVKVAVAGATGEKPKVDKVLVVFR